MILLQLFILILFTDMFTGTIHWWEDVYGNPTWKYLGKSIVIPNMEHHKNPRSFLETSFVKRIKLSALIAMLIAIIFFAIGMLNWQIIFVLFYSAMSNEFHAIAHRTDKENGRIIMFIQKIGFIQSRRMHGMHHAPPYLILIIAYLQIMLIRS